MTRPATLSLRSRMLRATSWVAIGQAGALAMRLLGNVITTRLLAPEMFGVIAIASTAAVVIALLSDLGIRESLIQSKRGEEPAFQNTAWCIQIVRGLIIWAGALLIALGIHTARSMGLVSPGSTYAAPLLPSVICVISFAAVINSFHSTKSSLAARNFDNKRLVHIDLMVQFSSTFLTMGLAWLTGSIWALVGGTLANALVGVLLSQYYLPGPRNRLQWEPAAAKELFAFGRWVFVSSAMTVVILNGDRILLGGFVGPDVLGLYAIALVLAGAIDGLVHGLISGISFPAFSEIVREGPERLAAAVTRMRQYSDTVLLLGAGFVFACGPSLIDLLYDHRYHGAGQILRILSFTMAVSRYQLFNQVYLALGLPRYAATSAGLNLAWLVVMVPLGYLTFGVNGAIAAIALKGLGPIPAMFFFNARHGLNNWKLELQLLAVWPVGAALGWLVSLPLAMIHPLR